MVWGNLHDDQMYGGEKAAGAVDRHGNHGKMEPCMPQRNAGACLTHTVSPA